MKKLQSEKLIADLITDVKIILECAEFFKQHKTSLLLQPAPGKWSIAQVLEHLNTYGRHYLQEINQQVSINNDMQQQAWFNPGILGDYFTNAIKPKSVFEVKNKMKTSKSHAPENNLQVDIVLAEFIDQQHKLLLLLEESRQRDLNTIRIPITITKLIKLKLGDAFRFIIAHEQRHMIQARNALTALGVATNKFPVILRATAQ